MKDKAAHFANITVCAAGIITAVFLGIRYALPAITPILLGYIFASITYKISDRIASKIKKHARVIRGAVCMIMIFAILFLSYLGIKLLIRELYELMDQLSRDSGLIEGYLDIAITTTKNSKFFTLISKILARADKYAVKLDLILQKATDSLLSSITAFVSKTASAAVSKIPTAILFLVTFISSAYYFCADRERISKYMSRILPRAVADAAKSIRTRISRYLISYLKASAFMFFTTLSVMLIFLSLAKQRYAFIISLLISVVDLLPILGAGTVIIPFGIYSLIAGNTGFSVMLFIMLLLLTVIRKTAESRMIGKGIGLHPLPMIGSIYIATKLFGWVGIIAGPMVCCILQSIFRENSKLQKKD